MMNLLANKTILQLDWIALDAGIVISWLSFMSMDVITKHFGPKASTKVSIFATFINVLVCFVFWVVSIIPSQADDYTAFNTIFPVFYNFQKFHKAIQKIHLCGYFFRFS